MVSAAGVVGRLECLLAARVGVAAEPDAVAARALIPIGAVRAARRQRAIGGRAARLLAGAAVADIRLAGGAERILALGGRRAAGVFADAGVARVVVGAERAARRRLGRAIRRLLARLLAEPNRRAHLRHAAIRLAGLLE